MVAVHPIEHVGDVAIAVVDGRRRVHLRVVGEVEYARRAGHRCVDAVGAIDVESGNHVVASRGAVAAIGAVGDPAQIIERVDAFVANQGLVGAGHERGLRAGAGQDGGGRRRRGAVARVDVVGGSLRLKLGGVLPEEHRAVVGIEHRQEAVRVAEDLRGPGQAHDAGLERKVDQPGGGVTGHAGPSQRDLAVDGALAGERGLRHLPADPRRGQCHGLFGRHRRRVRELFGHDPCRQHARGSRQGALGGEAAAYPALEDRNAVEALLEFNPAHVAGGIEVVGHERQVGDLAGRQSIDARVGGEEPAERGFTVGGSRGQKRAAGRDADNFGRAQRDVIVDAHTGHRRGQLHASVEPVGGQTIGALRRVETRHVVGGRGDLVGPGILLERADVEIRGALVAARKLHAALRTNGHRCEGGNGEEHGRGQPVAVGRASGHG